MIGNVVEREVDSNDDEYDYHEYPTATRRVASPIIPTASNENTLLLSKDPPALKQLSEDDSIIQQYLTPTPKDLANLSWLHEPSSTTSSDRFDFDGNLLDPSIVLPTHSGLYHHGLDADKCGYSIAELVHLSKSTFPSQRSLAFKSIGRIILQIYDSKYPNCDSIFMDLLKQKLLFSVRMALDDKNETVVLEAFFCLTSLLGIRDYQSRFLTAQEMHLYSTNGFKAFALSSHSIASLHAKLNGSPAPASLPNPKTLDEIDALCSQDFVAGLISTNILTRFQYLMNKIASPLKIQIIAILTVFAHHSPSAAEDILACAGLFDAIQKDLFLNWPAATFEEYRMILLSLRLISALAKSSHDACQSLVEFKVTNNIMRFLTLQDAITDTQGLEIARNVFSIIQSCFSFGLGFGLIDEYRFLWYEFAEFLFKKSNHGACAESLLCSASMLGGLHKLLLKKSAEMDVGGNNDAMLPFMVFATNSLLAMKNQNNDETARLLLLTGCYNFLRTYYLHAIQIQPSLSVQAHAQLTKLRPISATMHKLTNYNSYTYHDVKLDRYGIGIVQLEGLNNVHVSIYRSAQLEYLASEINFRRMMIQYAKEPVDSLRLIVQESLEMALSLSATSHRLTSFTAYLDQGISIFLESVLVSCMVLGDLMSKQSTYKLALSLVGRLLPGDEFLLQKLLDNILQNPTYIPKTISRNDIYEIYNLTSNEEQLEFSKSLLGKTVSPGSLILDYGNSSKLPLNPNWIFGVFSELYHEKKMPFTHKLMESKIHAALLFCKHCEPFALIGNSVKLVQLMHIFLMEDLFRSEQIEQELELFYKQLTKSTQINLEEGFENSADKTAQAKLFEFFRQLVEQFQSVSFGNPTFAKYLCLFLSSQYSLDYRIHFWSELGPLLKLVTWTEQDLPGEDISPFLIKEPKMRPIYQKAIYSGAITLERNRVMYQIATAYI